MAVVETKRPNPVAVGDRGVEQTLGRAAALLDALAGARRDGMRFTDLVDATGFSKATVHRLLAGLTKYGFVETDSKTSRLYLGSLLVEWGGAARGRHGILEIATPLLRDLADRLGDTIYLILRDGTMVVCAGRFEGPFPIRVLPLTPGDRNALGVGSGSMALLAALADPEIEQILDDVNNVAARLRRGVTKEDVYRDVEATRRLGYASSDLTPGALGIGLPVTTTATPTVAVSVASITERMQEPRRSVVVRELAATVDALRGRLQFSFRDT